MSDFHFSQGSPGSAPEASTEREKELLVALQQLLDEVDDMARRVGWSGYGARVRARKLLGDYTQADCGCAPTESCDVCQGRPRPSAAKAGGLSANTDSWLVLLSGTMIVQSEIFPSRESAEWKLERWRAAGVEADLYQLATSTPAAANAAGLHDPVEVKIWPRTYDRKTETAMMCCPQCNRQERHRLSSISADNHIFCNGAGFQNLSVGTADANQARTNRAPAADAGALPVDLIADFRDAIAIAKHRAEHAGDTARKKRWIEVRGRLDAYVQADRAPVTTSAAAMSDHVVRETVNQLRDIALVFHAHGSLRERIAGVIVPLLKHSRAATTSAAAGRTGEHVTMNGHQLKQALELAWPDGAADPVQGETVVNIARWPAGTASDEDGGLVDMPAGLYLAYDDLPSEGMTHLLEDPEGDTPAAKGTAPLSGGEA